MLIRTYPVTLSRFLGENKWTLYTEPCRTYRGVLGVFAIAVGLSDNAIFVAKSLQGTNIVLLKGFPILLSGFIEIFDMLCDKINALDTIPMHARLRILPQPNETLTDAPGTGIINLFLISFGDASAVEEPAFGVASAIAKRSRMYYDNMFYRERLATRLVWGIVVGWRTVKRGEWWERGTSTSNQISVVLSERASMENNAGLSDRIDAVFVVDE